MCKVRVKFYIVTFYNVQKSCSKLDMTPFGHVDTNLLTKSSGSGPGTLKCKRKYGEKHEKSVLNVGDLTLTIIKTFGGEET